MTLFHFLNCALLCYAPSFILYRALKLSDFRALSLCVYAGIGFALTELVKMLAIATLIPSTAAEEGSFSFFWEPLKQMLSTLLDFAGLSLVLTYVTKFPGDVKILGAGLGWATAKALIEHLLPLWLSAARSLEFEWTHITVGLESNINLLFCTAFTTLVWLSTRTGQRKRPQGLIYSGIAAFGVYQLAVTYMRTALHMDVWLLLGVHLAFSVGAGLYARTMYNA